MVKQDSTIFYSWQSDLPNKTNRGFIEAALQRAVKTIRDDESIRVEPVVKRDTSGIPGSPDIAKTIFERIEQADIFVGDVSIINHGNAGRPTPNPNVLVELGYALRALGPERIILVLNDVFGSPEVLPFDLRMRRTLRYSMPEDADERAPERRRLEAMFRDAVGDVLTHLRTATAGPESLPLVDQVREAIEGNQRNQQALARRFMAELADEIQTRNPHYQESERDRWDEIFMQAIDASSDIVVQFARLVETLAEHDAREAATAIYEGFGRVLDQYDTPPGYSGVIHDVCFDYPKFMAHELFITLFSFLIRDNRWATVGHLLEGEIYITNDNQHSAHFVPYWYVDGFVRSLEMRKQRLRLNVDSMHAYVLKERHSQGEIGQAIPMSDFTAADFFLYLRAKLQARDNIDSYNWTPTTYMYLQQPPRYLLQAERRSFADQLLVSLGVPDLLSFRERFAQRIMTDRAFTGFARWRNPLSDINPQLFGSR